MASTNSFISYKSDAFGVNAGQIAVSRDPWPEFFGEPRFPNSSAYDVETRDTQILPEAYKGNSKLLRDRTEFLVYTDENWYTQIVMPVEVVTNANKVVWNKTEYGTTIPGLVPELGTVRIQGSRRISGSAAFDRRGLGLYLEHGFMHTEAGRIDYQNQLQQIANSILECAKLDVINTLLNADDMNREWETKYGQYKGRHLRDVLQTQVWMWACLQKYERAEQMLETKVNSWMERYRGRADTWILPPQVQNYLSIGPSEMIEYYRAGPAGPARLADGPKAITTIGKSRVFIARTYEVDSTEGPRDLLTFPWEIGEYAVMYDRNRDKSYKGYRSVWRHVQIYNEDEDKMFEVKLKWALANCNRFETDGEGELLPTPASFDAYLGGVGPKEGGLDVFRYYDADDRKFHDVKFFGQMEPNYFPAADKLNLARTVLQAFESSSRDYPGFEKAWAAGMDLLDRIDANDNLDAIPEDGLFPADADTLVPGLSSWPGLQSMAAAADNVKRANPTISVEYGADAAKQHAGIYTDLKTAKEFVGAVRALVGKMNAVFPTSLVLDPAAASPWWKGADRSRETTFFENVVSRGRLPLFKIDGGIDKDGTLEKQLNAFYKNFENRIKGRPEISAKLKAGISNDINIERRRVLAYSALAFIDPVADDSPDAEAKAAAAEAAVRKIADLTSNFNFTRPVGGNDDTQAFLNAVFATKAYATPSKINDRINGYLTSNLPSYFAAAKKPVLQTSKYEPTGLVATPGIVRALAAKAAAGESIKYVPASTTSPDIAMTLPGLAQLSDKLGSGTKSGGEALNERVPAEFVGIASELGATSTVVAAAMRSGAEPIGASYDDYDNEMMGAEFPAGRLSRAAPVRSSSSAAVNERAAELATKNARSSWADINDQAGGDRLLAAIAHTFDYTPVTRRALERLIEQNVVFPIGFIVARPHMTYAMLCGIKVLAGKEMGNYFMRPGRFEVGDDVDVQAHIGTYTYYSKAVCTEPKNVFIVRNLFSDGYLGGNGVRPITPEHYIAGSGSNGQESVIVLAVPYAERQATDIIDLTGSIRMFEEQYQLQARRQLDYIGVDFYNRLFGWRQAQQNGEEAWSASDYLNEKSNVNTLCHPGLQLHFNPHSNEFDIVQRGRGHWGEFTYPSCAAVRRGELREFDRARAAWPGYIEA